MLNSDTHSNVSPSWASFCCSYKCGTVVSLCTWELPYCPVINWLFQHLTVYVCSEWAWQLKLQPAETLFINIWNNEQASVHCSCHLCWTLSTPVQKFVLSPSLSLTALSLSLSFCRLFLSLSLLCSLAVGCCLFLAVWFYCVLWKRNSWGFNLSA